MATAAWATPPSPVGDWSGGLPLPGGMKLTLVLHVTAAPSGYAASLDSPDQGALGLAVSSVSVDGDKLSFQSVPLHAQFHGGWDPATSAWVGEFIQGGHPLPLSLAHGAPPPPSRPQTPQKPYPYREVEVAYDNPGHAHLTGTLTLPQGDGPFPAALLIPGSGLHDRDATLFGHKPFLVIADALTRQGIAVLRVDERMVGGSTGDVKGATLQDFADDAAAGVAYLRTRPDIDPKKVGLIGHSQGGMTAPLIAAQDRSIAFMVILAGPAIPTDQLLLKQQSLIAAVMGAPQDQIKQSQTLNRQVYQAIETNSPEVAKTEALRLYKAAGLPEAKAAAAVSEVNSPFFRSLFAYNPQKTLAQVTCPVLALDGSLDLQVPAKENIAALKAGLSGDHDVTIEELPGLNHLFQAAKTGAPSEYAKITQTFDPAALLLMTDWVVRKTR
jgi:dienelactone hydrolase